MSAPSTAWEAEADGWGLDGWFTCCGCGLEFWCAEEPLRRREEGVLCRQCDDAVEGDAHGDAGDPRTGRGHTAPGEPVETGVALKCAEPEITQPLKCAEGFER